jgi:hypothetical protein
MVDWQKLKERAETIRSKSHDYGTERVVKPNDEPERGRVRVIARCTCGHEESGFGNVRNTAWKSALRRLSDHIEEAKGA